MAAGSNQPLQPVNQNRDTLATLIYTSASANSQRRDAQSWQLVTNHYFGAVFGAVQPQQAIASSVSSPAGTPTNAPEYFILSQGCTQIYTNIRNVKRDLQEFKPQIMVGVPRLWESIYEGAKAVPRATD